MSYSTHNAFASNPNIFANLQQKPQQGNTKVQSDWGYLYKKEDGILKNHQKAVEW